MDSPLSLVLASASPARLATLRSAGIHPVVEVAEVDEDGIVTSLMAAARHGGAHPAVEVVLELARAKATRVADRLVARGNPPDLVLGCDSMLEIHGEVVGKPGTAEVAAERWRRMRGGGGLLHTGHWLVDLRADPACGAGRTATTAVHFADLTDGEIEAYVATGEPLVVAGGFTVDGLGGPYVTAIAGDHHNVVGLSLPLFRELLAGFGIAVHELWSAL
ncbi:MAG: Maf family protein [Actinomycetota bacterium]